MRIFDISIPLRQNQAKSDNKKKVIKIENFNKNVDAISKNNPFLKATNMGSKIVNYLKPISAFPDEPQDLFKLNSNQPAENIENREKEQKEDQIKPIENLLEKCKITCESKGEKTNEIKHMDASNNFLPKPNLEKEKLNLALFTIGPNKFRKSHISSSRNLNNKNNSEKSVEKVNIFSNNQANISSFISPSEFTQKLDEVRKLLLENTPIESDIFCLKKNHNSDKNSQKTAPNSQEINIEKNLNPK